MTRLGIVILCGAALVHAQSGSQVRMIGAEGEGLKYWPRWRGPSGQGVVEGSGYVDTWSDTENVLWKVEAPGRGHSSPIVWGDRIFLTTAHADGPRRSILCYRRSDGKQLWETFLPAAPGERLYSKNSHASGTPSTDGERVYNYFGPLGLVAVDFSGKLVWQCDLGPVSLYHGTAGSPLLYKDRVIVFQDQRTGSYIAAVDKRTGKVIWKTPREEQIGWSTPVAIQAGTRDEIVVNSQNRVTAYDPATGKLLWWVNGTTMEVTPTPAVGRGLVFCSSGRQGPTLAIRPGGAGDVTATHVAWQTPRGSPFIPSPLVYGNYLYTVNDMTAVATCFEAATGKTMWQGRLGEPESHSLSASPIGVDGKVYFFNDSGEAFVVEAGPQFKLLRVNKLNERMLATPALVDGKWYFRTERHLWAIGR
jgi:outer membrane protein assembly factor BamB